MGLERGGSGWPDGAASARSSGGSAASGAVTYRARYAMPDGTRYSRTLATRMDAEAWLAGERALIDRDEWTPPQARRRPRSKRQREAAFNTVAGFAERYLAERGSAADHDPRATASC